MTVKQILERKILLKRQLVYLVNEEVKQLERQLQKISQSSKSKVEKV
ncbi:MAG: hypothetical protein M0P57_15030 [Syntrophales bacterium]|jgi:hypothetical protein|nr:hypothetical protein [Syntrophales bacterium]MDY0044421.1 hypothetical protein [Syntrophales bacterium]